MALLCVRIAFHNFGTLQELCKELKIDQGDEDIRWRCLRQLGSKGLTSLRSLQCFNGHVVAAICANILPFINYPPLANTIFLPWLALSSEEQSFRTLQQTPRHHIPANLRAPVLPASPLTQEFAKLCAAPSGLRPRWHPDRSLNSGLRQYGWAQHRHSM